MKAATKSAKVTKVEMTVGDPVTTVTLVSYDNAESVVLRIMEWHAFASVTLEGMEVSALVNSITSAVYEQEDRSFDVKDSDGSVTVNVVNWKVQLKIFCAGHAASVTFHREEAVNFADHIRSFYKSAR
jgi:hypothetical protein